MRRNSLSLQKKFSTRWRHLYISKSHGMVVTRLVLGGITAVVQIGADRVAVEGLVRQKSAEIEVRQKRGDTGAVVSGSRTNRTRLPSASTSATILVVKPPRDRPMA